MTKYKKIVWAYLITLASLSLLFFGLLYIQDPLKIFHKPWHHKAYLQSNMREQAAGIINNWKFDSIILGTSMLENTSAQEASTQLGGHFVNISMAGSSYAERKIVLEYALSKKNIKKVLYSLDTLGTLYHTQEDNNKTYSILNWDYLYDSNPLNDFNIYLTDRYLKCIFSFSEKKECIGEKVQFDRPNAWYQNLLHYYLFGGLDHWFRVKNNWQVIGASKNILKGIEGIKSGKVIVDKHLHEKIVTSQHYVDSTLIESVKRHPKTEFIFIVPPYSRMEYAIWAQYERNIFQLYKHTLKYIVKESNHYPNMKVYAWGKEDFLNDIANYQDLSHYEYKINSWELKAISQDKGLLSKINIDHYLDDITQKALHYDVLQYEQKFKDFLKN